MLAFEFETELRLKYPGPALPEDTFPELPPTFGATFDEFDENHQRNLYSSGLVPVMGKDG